MRRTIVTLAAALVLGVAGCGGDDDDEGGGAVATATPAETAEPSGGGGGGGETIALAAAEDGSLSFEQTELEAPAGSVTIDFDNPSGTPHAVAIEGGGAEASSETVTSATTSVTVDLEPGEYTFYCPVGNHRANGMEGTLTVG